MDCILLICQEDHSTILSSSDCIAIAEIVVTLVFGFWILTVVQNKFTNNRAVKDYFIVECTSVKEKYSCFFDHVYRNKYSSKYIQEWFKVMSIKIESFESSLKREFNVSEEIGKKHGKIKQFLTSRDELSEQYNSDTVVLEQQSKSELLKEHQQFATLLTRMVVSINKAKNK